MHTKSSFESEKYVKCVIVPADGEPYITRLKNDLVHFQQMVDGYIETVTFASDACVVVNEEGIIFGLPINDNIRPVLPAGIEIYGDAVIVGTKGEEFASLKDEIAEWLLDKTMKFYRGSHDD